MYDRILIPLDGSLPATMALYAGERLADRWGSEIKILTLLRKGDLDIGLDRTVAKQADRIRHERTVDIRSMTYSVVDDIASEFDAVDNTLIVMNTWARRRMAVVRSNVAEDVMRHIRKPMLLLGPTDEIPATWPSGPLMVCTDGSDFAESIVPVAAAWAESLDLESTVVSVIDPSKVPAGISPVAESNAVGRMARSIESLVGREVGYDTLHGSHPHRAIIDYARSLDASIIALATHGRSSMDRLAFGSVAMAVIRHATCPVLVSRPPVDLHR